MVLIQQSNLMRINNMGEELFFYLYVVFCGWKSMFGMRHAKLVAEVDGWYYATWYSSNKGGPTEKLLKAVNLRRSS